MNHRTSIITAALALSLLAVGSANVNAALITGVTVTASSEISTCCSDRDPVDIVNGSGLAAGLHDTNPGNMWLSTGAGFGGIDPDPFVLFDLGAVYLVDSFRVWNYNEAGAFATRGVNSVSVQFGTTPALGSTVAGITSFAQATGAGGYAGQNFNAFTPFSARFIKFDINTNHGNTEGFFGLSEAQFNGEIVPEPATATLGLLSLGGLLLRRRRTA